MRLGAELVGRLLGIGAQVLIARALGLAGYGEFAALGAVASVVATGADFGLLGLASRDVVGGRLRLATLSRARVVPSLAVAGLALAVLPLSGTLGFLLLAMVLGGWVDFLGAGLRSLGHPLQDAALLIAQRGGLLAIVLVAAGAAPTPAGIAALQALAALPVALAALALAWRAEGRGAAEPETVTALLRRAAPLALHSAFFLLGMRVELLVLRLVAGDLVAGAFAVALRFVEALASLPNAISAGAMPALTREARTGGRAALERTLATAVLLAAGLGAGLFWAGPWLVRVLFGPGFEAAIGPLRVLSVALLPLFAGNVWLHALVAAGRDTWLPRASGGRVLVGALTCAALGPHWGAAGAAVAYLTAETAQASGAGLACGRPGRARVR